MYRGTTPTYSFIMPEGVDLTLAQNVYVTFANVKDRVIFTKTGADLEVTASQVDVYLTQEETLSFPQGDVRVQLNWTYDQGGRTKRACSQKMTISTERNLIDRVLV